MSYGRERTPLFWSKDGFSAKQGQIKAALAAVEKLPENQILNTDPEALTQYFTQQYAVDVPVLDTENISVSQQERQVSVWNHFEGQEVRVPGVAFDFEIPFQGDAGIFQVRPDTYDTAPPHAEVRGNVICFSISGRDVTEEQLKAGLTSTRESIERYLSWHRKFWSDLSDTISRETRGLIDQRRSRLLQQKSIAAGLSSLGVKLKEKPSDCRTYVAPAVKQKLAPKMPPMRAPAQPEPTLDIEQYQTILALIRGAGRSIEQSSSRARELNEESLRDMFLVPLNAHFGSAAGEAFNHTGKTDLLIRHEGKNLFVAEFKFWTGDKQFLSAIDQLLSYLTWRDTKTVLIVFSRNTGFTGVLQKLAALPMAHPCFVSGPKKLDESSFQFEFRMPNDAERKVTLTVMGFDLGYSSGPRVRAA